MKRVAGLLLALSTLVPAVAHAQKPSNSKETRSADVYFDNASKSNLDSEKKEQLELAIERSSFEELKKQEDEEGYKEKPDSAPRFFRSGKAGEWRHELTPAQVTKIVRDHHEQMRRFGYLTQELMPLLRGM